MIHIAKPSIGEKEKQAVLQVLESGMLAQGKQTAELEACFTRLCGVKHAIATSSGTTALHTALLAHGIGPVMKSSRHRYFIASVNSILFTGATPVFADINEHTLTRTRMCGTGDHSRAPKRLCRCILGKLRYGRPATHRQSA
jgi:dTDP-4-amino-4,6-dideoxygalactose transaminase